MAKFGSIVGRDQEPFQELVSTTHVGTYEYGMGYGRCRGSILGTGRVHIVA